MLNQDGIEILETVPIMTYTGWSISILICGILIMIFSLVFWARAHKGERYVQLVQCLPLIGGLLLGLVISVCSLIQVPVLYEETGRYTYTCIIEDEVSMKDIYSNFEIVEAKGKIYTLKDK